MPSTAIRNLAYDSHTNELWVTFTSGRRYIYSNVPLAVFVAFSTAESKGTFFNNQIRDCYPYREINRLKARKQN